jgi:hypothetical protein
MAPSRHPKRPDGMPTKGPGPFNAHSQDGGGSGLVQHVLCSPARIPAADPSRSGPCAAPASIKRIKSLCGAKPPQKLRWTNAGRWAAIGAMEISPGTLGARADNAARAGWSAWLDCQYRGWEWHFQDDRQRHLEQGWVVGCVGDRGSCWRSEARSGKTGQWGWKVLLPIMAPWLVAACAVRSCG